MITAESLRQVDTHWAVLAVGDKKLRYSILKYSKAKFEGEGNVEEQFKDEDVLRRLSQAYELAAIEGRDDFINYSGFDKLQNQFLAGSLRAFEIKRILPIQEDNNTEFIFQILNLSTLAYCGGSLKDLDKIYRQHSEKIKSILSDQTTDWDKRVLYRLFQCWLSLFKKDSLDELKKIPSIISTIRKEQNIYEKQYLTGDSNLETRAKAIRIISFYQWAKATELISVYLTTGQPCNTKYQLNRHFTWAINLPIDIPLELLLRGLHASAIKMLRERNQFSSCEETLG